MARDLDRNANARPIVTLLLALVVIGAINWGLVGFFDWNLVDAIFGGGAREATSTASRVIYAIVGLSGLALLPFLPVLLERKELPGGV